MLIVLTDVTFKVLLDGWRGVKFIVVHNMSTSGHEAVTDIMSLVHTITLQFLTVQCFLVPLNRRKEI